MTQHMVFAIYSTRHSKGAACPNLQGRSGELNMVDAPKYLPPKILAAQQLFPFRLKQNGAEQISYFGNAHINSFTYNKYYASFLSQNYSHKLSYESIDRRVFFRTRRTVRSQAAASGANY